MIESVNAPKQKFDSVETEKKKIKYENKFSQFYGFDRDRVSAVSNINANQVRSFTPVNSAASNYIPSVPGTFDLGNINNYWNTVYANKYFDSNGDQILGFKTIAGTMGVPLNANTVADILNIISSDHSITIRTIDTGNQLDLFVAIDTTNFNNILSSTDDTLQKVLDTLDNGAVNTSTVASGVYTPTLTNVANLSASTAYECQYLRMGSTVTVSGKVDIDPVAGATQTQLGITLPIVSNLGAVEDCAGVAFCPTIAAQGAAILGDSVNNRAQLEYISGDVTNQPFYFTFSYQII
jgi:hypothetical protein